MNKLICVIGSGPSGIAAAHTLIKDGHKVMLIDVGFTLESTSKNILDNYRDEQDTEKLLKNIHEIRQKHAQLSKDQPLKTLFGSEYPYRSIPETVIENEKKTSVVRTSLAQGGFSSVWGSTVSTVVPKDIDDWPLTFDDLKPHYSSIENIMDVSSPEGEMSELFPMNIGKDPTFPLGLQGSDLYESLKGHDKELLDDGIHLGRAKLSVGTMYSIDEKGCTPCGLCMHGCPNNAIFNSAFALELLLKNENFTYRPGILLESFSEEEGKVNLYIKDLDTGNRSTQKCDRVFLACGVINSTCVVARSLKLTDHLFSILDSQKYIFPFIRWSRSKGAVKAKENTLAQIYLTVDNPSVSPNIVQVQYYGYNDLFLDPLRQKLGDGAVKVIPKIAASILERLMVVFVYLHSNQSGTLSLKVNEAGPGDGSLGEIRGHSNPESEHVIKSLLNLLKKHRHAHGGIPITAGLQVTLPGDSQHVGGTFPMSESPDKYQTDLLGRPAGCKRVHLVDSSVFPSVPGTPIVYTMMANSSRIASESMRAAGRNE